MFVLIPPSSTTVPPSPFTATEKLVSSTQRGDLYLGGGEGPPSSVSFPQELQEPGLGEDARSAPYPLPLFAGALPPEEPGGQPRQRVGVCQLPGAVAFSKEPEAL